MRDEFFEWDDRKAAENLRKHGVKFLEASTVLVDPRALTLDDPEHSLNEDRPITLGYSERLRMLMIVHTERGSRRRIISARRATESETLLYLQPR